MEDNPFYQHFKDEIERNQAEDAQLQAKYQQEQEMHERREKERARCAALVVPVLQDLLFKYPGHKVIDRAEVTYRSMKIDYHGIFWPGVTYSPQKPPVDWLIARVETRSRDMGKFSTSENQLRPIVGIHLVFSADLQAEALRCTFGNRMLETRPTREDLIAGLIALHTPTPKKKLAVELDLPVCAAMRQLVSRRFNCPVLEQPPENAGQYFINNWHANLTPNQSRPDYSHTSYRLERPVGMLHDPGFTPTAYDDDATLLGDWTLEHVHYYPGDEVSNPSESVTPLATVRLRLDSAGQPLHFEGVSKTFAGARAEDIRTAPVSEAGLVDLLLQVVPASKSATPPPEKPAKPSFWQRLFS